MTSKRFKFVCDDDNCFFKDNDKVLYCYEVAILLNELHSRNKRLEEKIQRERKSYVGQHLRWSKEAEIKIKELSEENEQLKKRIKGLEK